MKRICGLALLILSCAFHWGIAMAGPSHDAAAAGKVETLRLLLAGGADVNGKSDAGATPLHAAATWGHRDITELLLAKGADATAKDGNGWTPLHFTANGDHKHLSVLLIEKGAAVNAKALNGLTPLHVAAVWGHTSVATVLVAHGADVNARVGGDSMPFRMTESASRCHKDVSALLEKKGVGADAKAGYGMTPLGLAILNGQKDMAELLKKHGARE
jgi:cytohesin